MEAEDARNALINTTMQSKWELLIAVPAIFVGACLLSILVTLTFAFIKTVIGI